MTAVIDMSVECRYIYNDEYVRLVLTMEPGENMCHDKPRIRSEALHYWISFASQILALRKDHLSTEYTAQHLLYSPKKLLAEYSPTAA